MEVCIRRGCREIGGSCVEIRSGGQRLILDMGLPLDAENNNEKYLPDVTGLDGNDRSLLGILISHSHLDHFGLLRHISPGIPVCMGPAARRIIKAALPFLPGRNPEPAKGTDFRSGQTFEIGPFRITPYLVDHSAYDSYALQIESEGKRIFYSGDFRGHGRKSALFERIIGNPPADIDVLLLEGSSLGRLEDDQKFPTEEDIESKMTECISGVKGMVLIQTSVQNIDRIVSIFRACKKTGRKLVIDLYAAAVLEATGNSKIPQSDWQDIALYVPHAQRVKILRNQWFDLLKRHSANRIFLEHLHQDACKSVLLFRHQHIPDLERENCLTEAAYIYSQWEGYWDRGDYGPVREWLEKHNIPRYSIHTSGHAGPVDLKRFAEAVKPKKVVPIHSRMPEHYKDLFSNVETHNDNQWWEV
jgi:ribonuclease J